MIDSPQNRQLVAARKLAKAPGNMVLAEGPRAVIEAIAAGCLIERVYATATAAAQHAEVLAKVDVETVSERAMGALAGTVSPQGLVAVVANPALSLHALLARSPQRLLVLTDVRDPGNVGTALRAAEAAGLDGAVVCAGSCDPGNAKVVRASAGAVFHLPHVAGITAPDALRALVSFRRVGAAVDGAVSLAALDPAPPIAVAVGNEAWGFTPEVAALCDETVAIPMRGRVGSLNAGVAAALLAYRVAA